MSSGVTFGQMALDFFVSILFATFAYLLVPCIISFAFHKALSLKKIRKITVINGVSVLSISFVLQFSINYFRIFENQIVIPSIHLIDAIILSVIAYLILGLQKGHLSEINAIKRRLDETVSSYSTPFYIDFIKELKKVLPERINTLDLNQSYKECAYQSMHDFAQDKLNLYRELNTSNDTYCTQIQQCQKIMSDANRLLQHLKDQHDPAPVEPEKDSVRVADISQSDASDAKEKTQPSPNRATTAQKLVNTEFHPFTNAMEALVELGLAKCQYNNEAFRQVYENVKQRLQEDMADTEAQIRHSGKTPKEYVCQMIIDEIDHLKQGV